MVAFPKLRRRGPKEEKPQEQEERPAQRRRPLLGGRQQELGEVMGRIDEVCREQETLIPVRREIVPEGQTGIVIDREPRDEEERLLIKWARRLDHEGKTFEECPACGSYQFIETRYTANTISFRCTGCDTKFALQR